VGPGLDVEIIAVEEIEEGEEVEDVIKIGTNVVQPAKLLKIPMKHQ
jgi:3-deoxy-D-arabino-heptulosonate 7-phosphate (DAHP) synthase